MTIMKTIFKLFSEISRKTLPITHIKSFVNLLAPKNTVILSSNLRFKNILEMGSSSGKFVISKGKEKQMAFSTNSASSSQSTSSGSSNSEYVEDVVCKSSDLIENEPKIFDLDEGKVLLIKQNGQINAIGTKCTHYGAPLEKAAVGNGRIRCQWHGACFNITTGDIEDFPGLDSLPCYQVTIENDDVKVRAKKSDLIATKRIKTMAKLSPDESKKMVIIGGGPTGAVCAETLRQEGFKGTITLVTKEKYLPYDRIKLSKALNLKVDSILLRNANFYKENDIEVMTDVAAIGVDVQAKAISLNNGSQLKYDKLLLATGSKPNLPDIPGGSLKNIFTLREVDDAEKINEQVNSDKEAVVVGTSFIAMECASYLVGKVKKVTVIGRSALPFKSVFGDKIGEALKKLFIEKGVEFEMPVEIKEFKGNSNGEVTGVELKNGNVLTADFVVVGLGSKVNTEFLTTSGIKINTNGTVEVDEYLRTNYENIFAGGDIANAPIPSHDNVKASIGHWGLSHYHGKIAALNMIGKESSMKTIPYFWTMLFGKSVRYAGHGNADDIIYVGNVDELKFVAFYLKGDDVVAISSCQMDPIVSQFAEFMINGNKLTRSDLQNDPLKWTKLQS